MRYFLKLSFCLMLCVSLSIVPARALQLFVAPNGNDAWSGRSVAPNSKRSDGPFATLARARDEIRRLKTQNQGALPRGGVVVELRAGNYELAHSFDLEARDSGTAAAPIEYRAWRGEKARLVGGKALSGWQKTTDPAVLSRLDSAARGQVWQTDLAAQGLTDLPDIESSRSWGQSKPGVELFFQAQPMTLARWPNTGFSKVVDVVGGEPLQQRDPKLKVDKRGVFVYEGERPTRWTGENEVWLHGYWAWDWADQRQRVASIDTAKHTISLAPPDHEFGYRVGQWYYAFNVLAELDQPGEWYLDRQKSILYFWPPAPLSPRNPATLSLVSGLINGRGVSHVTLRGLSLEAARGTAVTIEGGDHVRLSACTVRDIGSWAVRIRAATESGVEGCDISNTGDGGIELVGGDRKTLTPAHLYADNNHIFHYSRWNPVYNAAVRVEGVGCRVSHNLINDAPHLAIGLNGNDHLIEFNEIHNVCQGSNDAGTIYAGADWTMRGNIIRSNYLHHIYGLEGRGAAGVYLDDNFSSATVENNLFYQVSKAVFVGGGRDNTVQNNVFVACDPALYIDARGLGWRASGLEDLTRRLQEMPFGSDLWRARYPGLATILQDEPMAPKGNLVARNIFAGGRAQDIEDKARPYLTLRDNLSDSDPLFVDPQHGNFQLRPDSPAFKLGFQRISLEKIGLYRDAERASWPVVHLVQGKPQATVSLAPTTP